MIRVKDVYISIKDIKKISYEMAYMFGTDKMHYLVIDYIFDDKPISITVDSFEDYETQADFISEQVNLMK